MSRVTSFVLFAGVTCSPLHQLTRRPIALALKNLKLADTTIISADVVTSGTFTPPGERAGPLENLPAFCAVHGVIKPTPKSVDSIRSVAAAEQLERQAAGRRQRRLAGTIGYPAMASALREGLRPRAPTPATPRRAADMAAGSRTADRLQLPRPASDDRQREGADVKRYYTQPRRVHRTTAAARPAASRG